MSTSKDIVDANVANLTMADLGPLEALLCAGYPRTWADLAPSIYTGLYSIKPVLAKPEKLAEAAMEITFQISKDFGGQQFYMPSGSSYKASKMKDSIKIEFKGNNVRQLAIKYGVSTTAIRTALKD